MIKPKYSTQNLKFEEYICTNNFLPNQFIIKYVLNKDNLSNVQFF